MKKVDQYRNRNKLILLEIGLISGQVEIKKISYKEIKDKNQQKKVILHKKNIVVAKILNRYQKVKPKRI